MRYRLLPLPFLLVVAFFFSPESAGAQQMTIATKRTLDRLKENAEAAKFSDLPVYRMHGEWFLSLYGILSSQPEWEEMRTHGVLRGGSVGKVATVKIPLNRLPQVDLSRVFSYVEIPQRISPDVERARFDTRANAVHAGIDLPQGYHGNDVLIGITDWGFDYTHPMLYDTLVQQTRIVAAWDQFKNSGPSPDGFDYGTVYTTPEALSAAQCDTSNIYSFATHGMHVAGIAAGGGAGTSLRGIAPGAGLLLNTFLIDAASVIDAFVWMKETADELQKRLVINMSWGLHSFGTLDGNSLLSQAIDALAEEGVVFVSSAGNNGDVNFHIRKQFNADTIHTRIQFGSMSINNFWGQCITMWGEQGKSFRSSLRILSGNNSELAASPYYLTQDVAPFIDSILVVGNDTIHFNLTTEAAHPLNGRPHMSLRIKALNSTYKFVLSSAAEDGEVHYWNVIELTTGVGNWGYAFLNPGVGGGIAGNAQYGIAEPACAAGALAVAAHAPEYLTSGGTLVGGSQANFTSIGPLITGVMKPDISGPGVNINSSVSSFTDAPYFVSETVLFNGIQYPFSRFSGTSMSSPAVAGIAALVLEANPQLTAAQVRDIIRSSARLDNYTGSISAPGHPTWGYGKANALAAVQLALNSVGVAELDYSSEDFLLFPNPANGFARLTLETDHTTLSAVAIDASGRTQQLNLNGNVADTSLLASGSYIVLVRSSENRAFVGRLIVQRE